jgi:hypothetical protein
VLNGSGHGIPDRTTIDTCKDPAIRVRGDNVCSFDGTAHRSKSHAVAKRVQADELRCYKPFLFNHL